ncbi:MAG: hypothetical protein AAGM46_08335 [Cyanobacteria bacterium J06582_2]
MISQPDFTLGNTITVAVAVYKQNWRKFLQLSLVAHLWLLIPIYGWARYFAIAALISKLASEELNGSADLADNNYFAPRSLFVFLFAGILTTLIPLILGISCCVLLLVVYALIYFWLLEDVLVQLGAFISIDLSWVSTENWELLLGASAILFIAASSIWFYSKLFLTDLTFIEARKGNLFSLFWRSYILTRKKIKIFGIILQSLAVAFPIWFLSYFILIVIIGFSAALIDIDIIDQYSIQLFFGCWLSLANLLTLPYWQGVKSVVHYELTKANDYDLMSNRQSS